MNSHRSGNQMGHSSQEDIISNKFDPNLCLMKNIRLVSSTFHEIFDRDVKMLWR